MGTIEQEVSVEGTIDSGCSTSVLDPLSRQILAEMSCLAPGHFAILEQGSGIEFAGSAVYGLVTAEAKVDLLAAVDSRTDSLRINSGFRTVAQQYLLYRWRQAGRCGITAAATPGRSNHESGRALDIGNYSTWKTTLEAHGWFSTVPGDPVHFDHTASGDSRGMDVHAFQRLWNRNNPEDLIDEDGTYGTETGTRLSRAPVEGFAISGCDPDLDLDPDPGLEPDSEYEPGKPDLGAPGSAPELSGGCSTGGSAGSGTHSAWLLCAVFVFSLRRRQ